MLREIMSDFDYEVNMMTDEHDVNMHLVISLAQKHLQYSSKLLKTIKHKLAIKSVTYCKYFMYLISLY